MSLFTITFDSSSDETERYNELSLPINYKQANDIFREEDKTSDNESSFFHEQNIPQVHSSRVSKIKVSKKIVPKRKKKIVKKRNTLKSKPSNSNNVPIPNNSFEVSEQIEIVSDNIAQTNNKNELNNQNPSNMTDSNENSNSLTELESTTQQNQSQLHTSDSIDSIVSVPQNSKHHKTQNSEPKRSHKHKFSHFFPHISFHGFSMHYQLV